MSKKYHISKNGTPAVCHAQPGKCPIGGNEVLFNSPKKALEYADNKNHLEVLNENLEEAANPSDPKYDALRTDRAQLNLNMKGSQVYVDTVNNVLSTTAEPDGGSTYNPYVKTSPQVGFCYSPYPERSVEFNSVNDLTLSTYEDYCERNKDLLSKENHYVGTWNDPVTGKIYLDVSVNTMDAKEARTQCEEKDQIAYFDLQDFSSVTVNQNATSGQSDKKET